MAGDIRVRAFAKINLTLRVVGMRPDGYHELQTQFQSLALHDTLTFTARKGPFQITCDDPACPVDAGNLVWQAAERMWRASGRRTSMEDANAGAGVTVRITKRIPVQAGLGGGSSDAAATLRALAALWRVPVRPHRLREMAAALGADVPFFLQGGSALGVERGDVLVPMADAPAAWVVIVVPGFGVSTREAYGWFDEDLGTTPADLARRADPGARTIHREPGNDLQGAVAKRHPEITRIVRKLERLGSSCAAMSGSGSAVFGLFDARVRAEAAVAAFAGRTRRAVITRTLDRAKYRVLVQPRPMPRR